MPLTAVASSDGGHWRGNAFGGMSWKSGSSENDLKPQTRFLTGGRRLCSGRSACCFCSSPPRQRLCSLEFREKGYLLGSGAVGASED
jgi:hypothetical protein